MKLSELLACNSALTAVKDNPTLSFKVSYAIAINAKMFETFVVPFQESQKQLVDMYAERDAEGNIIEKDNKVTITDVEAYNSRLKTLLETDCCVSLHMIKKSELETSTISPSIVINLLPLIEEE